MQLKGYEISIILWAPKQAKNKLKSDFFSNHQAKPGKYFLFLNVIAYKSLLISKS
jgi:hypothetical protein